jgi:tyrosyl-tRNA synthetase
VEEIETLKNGHPKEAKMALASELVSFYHGAQAAQEAAEHFKSLFGGDKRNEIPSDAPLFERPCPTEGFPILSALMETQLITSNGEGKRLIKQGGLVINGERANDLQMSLLAGQYAIRAGKKRWARLIIT